MKLFLVNKYCSDSDCSIQQMEGKDKYVGNSEGNANHNELAQVTCIQVFL